MNVRVLAIGMFDSIHFARWLEQFKNSPIEFLLFPSSPHRRLNSKLQSLLAGNSRARFSLIPCSRFLGVPLWVLDKILGNRIRGCWVALVLRIMRPNFIHALELQNAGYIALRALKRSKPAGLKLIVTNYGSDIYWFKRFDSHREKLADLLRMADYYACECRRDIDLARDLGFQGQTMPVLPNAGGIESAIVNRALAPLEARNKIMIKGYDGWVGRAHTALQAVELISSELKDFEIVVYSCNLSTKRRATQLAKRTGLKVTAYSKNALSHNEMVEKFSRSLIYVGLSLSDGISTSMLEAMAVGAIPVQTSTACCDEWFSDTGVAISNLAVEEVAHGIKRGIELALTTESAAKNRETIRSRATREEIAKQAQTFYKF